MADIKTRAGEGRPLTNNEVDANFTNLNTDKAENGANTDITSLAGITGGVSTADYVDFDTLASGVARATGRLTWNDTDGCLEVGLKGSDVTQQIGQEMLTRVYNADSTTIANGEVVYFWSTAGEVIAGKKYIANATIDPHLIVGLATENIAAGSYGYVTEFGFVRGLDTAAFNPGDILFCSPTVAGAIQSNEPSTPNDVVRIGICLESDSTNGIVLVNPHDVPRADEIRYDNADSGLSSTNVKSAIDELELVKADIALLTSNVTFYLTSANDSVLAGYKQLVTSTLDTNYDEIAFDYLTSSISNTATMLQAWVSDVNVLVGDIAGIVVPIVGNIRKDTGSGDARFYFEVYIRESDGTETLVTTSNVSDYITSTIYGQISLSATVSLQTFTDTDRVVIKLYGQTDSSTAAYELQLGGSSPFRSLFPVPVSVVPSVANAYAIVADTTNFNGKLSSTDNNVQEALETLDDHVHQASEITGLTASNTTTSTSQFNNHLSALDTDIQKALNTLDDVDLQGITDVGATTTTAVTINAELDVDDLKLDGDTISNDGAAVDGNIVLSPKGAGEVDISKVDIDGGAIDGTTIGGTTPGAGTFTDLTVNTTATFAGATIADLGTVTTADINGGTIDGVALDATIADIDNIRIDGNSIISTNGNGNIDLTPNGLGEVNISKVDIAAGEIDGTIIGATVAAAGNFTALDVSTSASFAGATIDNLGTVTTADINGGTIDGADITVGTGKTLHVSNGTLTLADDQISGDKIHGGIISSFASTGIDDNASSNALTLSSNNATFTNDVTVTGDLAVDTDTLVVDSLNDRVGVNLADPDEALEVAGDIKANTGGTAGVYHFGSTSDQTKIVGRDNSHATLPSTMGFFTDGDERIRISAQGLIGIGTDNPTAALTIERGTYTSNEDQGIEIIAGDSSGLNYWKGGIKVGSDASGVGELRLDAPTGPTGTSFVAYRLNNASNGAHIWSGEDGTEFFRVNQVGMGIGVNNPDAPLEVYSGVADDEVVNIRGFNEDRGLNIRIRNGGAITDRDVDFNNELGNGRITFSFGGNEHASMSSGGIRVGNGTSTLDGIFKKDTPAITVGGTTTAAIITTSGTSASSGHVGIEIPSNDSADGFYIATDADSDGVVDTLAVKINAIGQFGIGGQPSYTLDAHGGTTATFALRSSSNTGNSLIFFGRPNDVDAGRVGYDHTSDLMYFRTGGSEGMRIDNQQRVGLGGIAPAAALHIAASDGGEAFIQGGSNAASEASYWKAQGRSAFGYNGAHVFISDNGASKPFELNLGGSRRALVDHTTGNMTLGTTATTTAGSYRTLTIVSTHADAGGYIRLQNATNNEHCNVFNFGGTLYLESQIGQFSFRNNSGTNVMNLTTGGLNVTSSSNSPTIRVQSPANSNYTAQLKVNYAEEAFNLTGGSDYKILACDGYSVPNNIKFYISNSEKMRLDPLGSLLIGRSSATTSATDYGITLYSSGQIYCYSNSSGNGDVFRGYNSAGTNTSAIDADGDYINLSDRKYKDNIADSERGLADILDLNVVSFDWNTTGQHQSSGLIAQEVQEVIPELVTTQEDTGDLRLKGTRFYPILIKAIQEQQAMIETLQAEVAALKGA